jgi:hypothetical protein
MARWLKAYPVASVPDDQAERARMRQVSSTDMARARELGARAARVGADAERNLRENHYIARIYEAFGYSSEG